MGRAGALRGRLWWWGAVAPLALGAALTRCGSGSGSSGASPEGGAGTDSSIGTQGDAGSQGGSPESGSGLLSGTCGVTVSAFDFTNPPATSDNCAPGCGPSTGSAYLPDLLPGPGSNCVNETVPECVGAFCPTGQSCIRPLGSDTYQCQADDAGCASGCPSYQICQAGSCVNAACTPPPGGCPAQMPASTIRCAPAGPACPYPVDGQVAYCVQCADDLGQSGWDCQSFTGATLPCLAPGASPPPVDAGSDAGFDAGAPDSGFDAGFDAGPPDTGPAPILCDAVCRLDQNCDGGECLDNPCVAPPMGCPADFPGGGLDSGCDAGPSFTCVWPEPKGEADFCQCVRNTHWTCQRRLGPVDWSCIPMGATALGYPEGGDDAGD